jgi:hypothetical protein
VWGEQAGNPNGRDHLEDPGIDKRTILKWVVQKWGRRAWTG